MNKRILKGIRVTKGYNQQQMADAAEMNLSTYCNKENEKGDFSLEEIKKIATFLNLSLQQVDEIFFDKTLTNGKEGKQTTTFGKAV